MIILFLLLVEIAKAAAIGLPVAVLVFVLMNTFRSKKSKYGLFFCFG